VKQTQQYTVDGVTYRSFDDMPPDVRKKWDSVATLLSTAFGGSKHTFGRPVVTETTIKFEQTVEQSEVNAGLKAVELPMMGGGTGARTFWETSAQDDVRKLRSKRISLGFCILFFPMFSLTLVAMLSSVKTTVHYGPYWTAAYITLMTLLLACMAALKDELHTKFFPNKRPTPLKALTTVMGIAIGFGVLAAYAIYGGAPIIAHHLTAHPGELTVTVVGKDSSYQRYACTPRIKIDEFTFFYHNHLCPGDRAYSEIDVGARIRLQGDVSPFGISVNRFFWNKHG
jgi:hypothetical protein